MHCDLASLTSVRHFVENLRCGWNLPQDTRHLQAHCLIHAQPVRVILLHDTCSIYLPAMQPPYATC